MKSSRTYLVNVIAQGSGRALSMVSGFIVFILVARVFGAEVLGQYAFVMAFVLVAGGVAEFGTTAGLTKDLPGVREGLKGDAEVYFGNYLLLRFLLGAAVTSLGLVVALFVSPNMRDLLFIGSLAIPFVGARFCETVYQVYHRPIFTFYSSLSLALLQLGLSIILLFLLDVDLRGFLYGFVVTQVVYFLVSIYLATRLLTPRFKPKMKLLFGILTLSLPMGVWATFNLLGSRADVFILSYFRSSHEVGVYNSAYRLLDLAVAVAITFTAPLVPLLSGRFNTNSESAKRDCLAILELSVLCLLPIPMLLPHVSDMVVVALFGKAFLGAGPLLDLFSWVFLMLGVTYISMSINLAAGNITHTWWNGMISAVINILLNIVLIPRWGAMGAAVSVLISMGSMLLVSLYFTRVNIGHLLITNRMTRILLAAVMPWLMLLFTGSDLLPYTLPLAIVLYVTGLLVQRLLPLEYLKIFQRQENSE